MILWRRILKGLDLTFGARSALRLPGSFNFQILAAHAKPLKWEHLLPALELLHLHLLLQLPDPLLKCLNLFDGFVFLLSLDLIRCPEPVIQVFDFELQLI